MIVLSNSTTQTIEPGGFATFDTVVLHTGCSERHREGTGVIGLSTRCNCNKKPIYEVFFNGNVGGAAATQANLVVSLGEAATLKETTMTATITAATDVQNVAAHTVVDNCDNVFNTLAIKNVGTTPVTLAANPSFTVLRKA